MLKVTQGVVMKCKYMKPKINKGVWCIYNKERVSRELCSKCNLEDRYNKEEYTVKKKVKNKSIAKLERDRFSILTNDLSKCIVENCRNKKDHLHEVFPGRNRSNSMRYGCVIPLCEEHHKEIHVNSVLSNHYKVLAQQEFIKVYPYLDFVSIFRRNYL